LNNLSYLLELDVSNNKIRKLFDFWPPCNLKEADFSFNLIDEIKNLDNFHYLQKLILDSMWIFFFPNENKFTLIYFSR
jgi:Leucine-rich repeat (LRR) protein